MSHAEILGWSGVAWYVVSAVVNSSPKPPVQWSTGVFYKWIRDVLLVMVNQHRDDYPILPVNPAKEK